MMSLTKWTLLIASLSLTLQAGALDIVFNSKCQPHNNKTWLAQQLPNSQVTKWMDVWQQKKRELLCE